jgi:hypothetical protein
MVTPPPREYYGKSEQTNSLDNKGNNCSVCHNQHIKETTATTTKTKIIIIISIMI